MTPLLRNCLLAGCAALALLDAPQAGALLAQGVAGPYGAHEAQVRPEFEQQAAERQDESTESLGALRDAGGETLPGQEPWRKGLPRGL